MISNQRVRGSPGLIKDPKSGAIVNTDDNERRAFEMRRQQSRQIRMQTEQIASLEQRVAALERIVLRDKENG